MKRTAFSTTLIVITLVATGGMSPTHAAIIYVDSNTTLSTNLSGNDIYTGLHANNVTATIADGAFINGDQFTGGIRAFGNSRVNVTGGTVAGIDTLTSSVLTVTGGTVTSANDYTNALINGGVVTNLNILNISNSNYNSVGRATVTGGTISHITDATTGSVTMSGGALTGYFASSNISTFNLSGGTITGTIYSLDQYNTINLFGSNLSLTNPVSARSADFNGVYTGTYYDLRGKLSDGTDIATKFFTVNPLATTKVNLISVVPEPSSLALLLIPALGLVARRRIPARAK